MNIRHIEITPCSTYATKQNAIKAVEKKLANLMSENYEPKETLRYITVQGEDGRWFPVFIGANAARHGIHFSFNILA